MRLAKYIIIIFLFFFDFVLADIKNQIIVKVENQIITNFEIKNKILSTLVINKKDINQKNINLIKKQILETLIQSRLKKIELSKYEIKKDDRQVQMYLQSISANNINELKKKFAENEINYDLFLSNVSIELMWQEFIYKMYKSKIQINEKKIEEDLNKLINNKTTKEYNLSEIELDIDDNTNEEEKILNIINLLKKEKFENIAKKFSSSKSSSDGGKLGWIAERSLSKEIYNSVKSLNEGDITKPIKKQNSIIFLKVNKIKHKKMNKENITDLKAKLINERKNKLFNLYSQSHLSKLKNNSLIEYK